MWMFSKLLPLVVLHLKRKKEDWKRKRRGLIDHFHGQKSNAMYISSHMMEPSTNHPNVNVVPRS